MSGGIGRTNNRRWYTILDKQGRTQAIIKDKARAECFRTMCGGDEAGWRILEGRMYVGCEHNGQPDDKAVQPG